MRNSFKFGTVFLFIIFVKFFGFVKEVLFLRNYGYSIELDYYNIIFISMISICAFINSAFSMLLIPAISNNYINKKLFNKYLFYVFKYSIIFYIFILSIKPAIIKYVLNPNIIKDFDLFNTNYYILFLGIIFNFMISLINSFSLSRLKNYNSYLEVFPSLTLILIIFLFNISPKHLSYFYLIGLLIQFFLSYYLTLKLFPNDHVSPKIILFSNHIIIVIITQLVIILSPFIDVYFSFNFNTGLFSFLQFSNKIIGLFQTIFSLLIIRIILPSFSRIDSLISINYFIKILISFLFISFILILLYLKFDIIILKLFFVNSNLDYSSFSLINNFIKISLIQIPFYVVGVSIATFFTAKKLYKFPFFIALTSIISKFIYLYFFNDINVFQIIYSNNISIISSSSISFILFLKYYNDENRSYI